MMVVVPAPAPGPGALFAAGSEHPFLTSTGHSWLTESDYYPTIRAGPQDPSSAPDNSRAHLVACVDTRFAK